MKNNKLNLALYFCVSLIAGYLLYVRYIRFFLADNETIAIAMLNPTQLPTTNPALFSFFMLALAFLLVGLMRLKPTQQMVYRLFKGLYGFSLVFMALQLMLFASSSHLPESLAKPLFESKNLFVEVQTNDTRLRRAPSLDAEIIGHVDAGTLLLLNDIRQNGNTSWNRVLLAPREFAWIARITTDGEGESKRLSKTNKFYFRRADSYSLWLSIVGFVWGVFSYRKR